MTTHRVHHGRAIKRLREIRGVKQEALALTLGEGWSQKRVSVLEARAIVSPHLLQQIARVLGVATETIEDFDETAVCQHLFSPAGRAPAPAHVEWVQRLLTLMEENRSLYLQLLEAHKEKCALLERLLDQKKETAIS